MLTISPFAFFTLRSLPRKYQNRDFATTSLGAKIRIRYSFGVGLDSVGKCRPITWYSLRPPAVKFYQLQLLSSLSGLKGSRGFCYHRAVEMGSDHWEEAMSKPDLPIYSSLVK